MNANKFSDAGLIEITHLPVTCHGLSGDNYDMEIRALAHQFGCWTVQDGLVLAVTEDGRVLLGKFASAACNLVQAFTYQRMLMLEGVFFHLDLQGLFQRVSPISKAEKPRSPVLLTA